MRDDERYPTVVHASDLADAPEVTTSPPMDLEGRDMLVDDNQDGLIPIENEATVKKDSGEIDRQGGEPPTKPERKCCGMKRKTFLITLSVLAIVLIAAIVGGVVGGIKANSSSDNNDSATSTSSGSGPVETGPIDADERSMAAAVVNNNNKQNIQVFYNNLNTTNIMYRRIYDNEGSDSHTLDLDITPNWGAPIAAAARHVSSKVTTSLYYITTDNDETQIAEAVLDCGDIDSGAACSVSSNSLISSNLTRGVHQESKLAALRLNNDSMRVYFQAAGSGSNIWVLYNDNGYWAGSNIIGNVMEGSAIAAAAQNQSSLHVFYVSNSTERLAYVNYADILGASTAQAISDSPGTSWSPDNAISATYVPDYESYRLYYTNPKTGNIVSYYTNSTQPWGTRHDKSWGKPASSIASVAWGNRVRIMYFEDDKLVMSAQNASIWADPVDVTGS